MNDSDLLKRLREQDPEAVRSLTRSYLPSIWRFVSIRVKGDEHLAEDIVSETVVALIRAAGEEVEIENPVAWMRSVAQNKVMDHFRSAARVRELIKNITHTTSGADNADAASLQLEKEKISQVRQIMDGLTEQYRIALEWKYLEQLSVREMAERWDTTDKATESILFRARREFRDRHREIQARQESPRLEPKIQDQNSPAMPPKPPDPPQTVLEFSENRHSASLKNPIF